ncbi:hypothetical protein [Limnoglobus roseus]|uniref:Uncharacterized protein n=1 Tax=Limnoglobus roseus TaxID=2598579 RepID=A0A5C1AI42_9BACT|nr:hypothetical protein [Limnoglobus roseus]QEL18315.1 hypothetical protein PX52LOC_05336 [Limnoglobus roseus]
MTDDPYPGLAAVPASLTEVLALQEYDPSHVDGSPWRYRHVTAHKQAALDGKLGRDRLLYAAEIWEAAPWVGGREVQFIRRSRDPVATGLLVARYLKWRWGEDWTPPATGQSRRPFIEAFNDELDPKRPAVWVGRIWQNGTPHFVFANPVTEAGFPTEAAAVRAASDLVRERMPDDWRTWLARSRRPWVGPMPANRLDPVHLVEVR